MCGLAGFIEFSGPGADHEDLTVMQKAVRHRGPDDSGYYSEPGVGLCHTRLSILDLSQKAHQPMISDGLILVYNGEIYNFRALRTELEALGHQFESHSDTEVLLKAYRQWGQEVLLRLNGMFAFAIYDRKTQTLFAARDRCGVKPLVYYLDPLRFVFASELKAIKAYPYFQKKISMSALEDYLRFGYVTGKQTIWENCFCLLPGECLTVDKKKRSVNVKSYWFPRFTTGTKDDFHETAKALKAVLINEFQQSMVSDVPVGVCLSGGVDSNVLTAILAKELGFSLRTYSLGGNATGFDENARARAVAGFLGTEHVSLTMDSHSSRNLWRDTILHYDQPASDQNMLSFRCIAREAKKDGVTVLLSGVGGDELFFGYPAVSLRARIQCLFHIPQKLRNLVPKKIFRSTNKLYKSVQLFQLQDHLAAIANISGKCFFDDEIDRLLYRKKEFKREDFFQSIFSEDPGRPISITEKIMLWDFKSYLVDNGLYILDNSSMLEGVEMRVPYLNNNVLEHAFRTPVRIKRYQGEYKALLKSIEREYLPKRLRLQSKRGFYPFPKSDWLDGDLQADVGEYLSEFRFKKQGIFNYDVIKDIKEMHKNSRVNVSDKIWNMLIFQIWAEHNL